MYPETDKPSTHAPKNFLKRSLVVNLSGVASLSQSFWLWVQAKNENSTFTFGSKPRNLLILMEESSQA